MPSSSNAPHHCGHGCSACWCWPPRSSPSPTCAGTAADGWRWPSSTTCATTCSATCRSWTSPASTSSRPDNSWRGPTRIPRSCKGFLGFLPIMSGNVLMMLLSLVVMVYLSPLLALVSLVIAPALLVVSYRMRRRIFPATWDAQQREGELIQIVDEDVNGVRVVKAFGQEQREVEKVADAASRSLRLPAAGGATSSAVSAAAAGDPGRRAGRDPGPGWLAGPAPRHQPRYVPGLLDLRSAADGAGPPARRHPRRRAAGPRGYRADLPAPRPEAEHRRPTRRGRTTSDFRDNLVRGRPLRLSRRGTDPERVHPRRRRR